MSRRSLTSDATRRQALLRHLTVWAGLVCLFAQFSSALHLVLVEHVRCAEHGELVHTDRHQHADHGSADLQLSPNSPAISPSNSDSDHGHDHCWTCGERRKLTLLSAATPELRAAQVHALLFTRSRPASTYTGRLYAYAPKTSPPV